jgi:hypothetical protein
MAELKKYEDRNHPDAGGYGWVFPGKRNQPLDMGWLMSKHIKRSLRAWGSGESTGTRFVS